MGGEYRFRPEEWATLQRMQRAPLADIECDRDAFSPQSFAKLSEWCVSLAAEAKALADAAPLQRQEHYLLVAYQWLRVAEALERAILEAGNAD